MTTRTQDEWRLDKTTAAELRRKGLVEGRYPNIFPAGEVAAAGEKVAEYVEAKGFDDDFFMHRILQFLCVKGTASRKEVEIIHLKHLSTALSDTQKRNKIGNLLSVSMCRQRGWITNIAGKGHSSWALTPKGSAECRRGNASCRRKCHAAGGIG